MEIEYEGGERLWGEAQGGHFPHLPQGLIVRAALQVPQRVDNAPNGQAAAPRCTISVRNSQRVYTSVDLNSGINFVGLCSPVHDHVILPVCRSADQKN